MRKKFDVVALGELLIDFTPAGVSPAGSPVFESNPGGAPANLLTAVTRQGGSAAFIGKVGNDFFGNQLKNTLIHEQIDVSGLSFDDHVHTTLAFVSLDETGNRSFTFFRNPGADIMLTKDEVNVKLIDEAGIFHFGSLSCTDEPSYSATKYALEYARSKGVTISYDPNLRPALWSSLDRAKQVITDFLAYANILKISDEEFTFLTGETDYAKHAPDFAQKYNITLLFVTLGKKGAYFYYGGKGEQVPTYDVAVVDTTGSGDSFGGAMLNQINRLCETLHCGICDFTHEQVLNMVQAANASGSYAATKKGGIPSIPTAEEIQHCMQNVKILEPV